MKALLIRWFINGLGLWLAMQLVPGIHGPNNIIGLVMIVVLFGLLDTVIRPLFWLLSCPLILITLAPMILGLNALLLWLSAWLAGNLGLNFTVAGFGSALLGAIVVSTVRLIVTRLVQSQERKRAFSREQVWIGDLEQYKVWLEKQRANWKQLAEEQERVIQEQQALIVATPGDRQGQQYKNEHVFEKSTKLLYSE